MTDRQLDNRAKKIAELEEQIAELQAQVESVKDEIKADMTEKGKDEISTGSHIFRWKEVTSNRLDSASLKKVMPAIYTEFVKVTTSKRFTIA